MDYNFSTTLPNTVSHVRITQLLIPVQNTVTHVLIILLLTPAQDTMLLTPVEDVIGMEILHRKDDLDEPL